MTATSSLSILQTLSASLLNAASMQVMHYSSLSSEEWTLMQMHACAWKSLWMASNRSKITQKALWLKWRRLLKSLWKLALLAISEKVALDPQASAQWQQNRRNHFKKSSMQTPLAKSEASWDKTKNTSYSMLILERVACPASCFRTSVISIRI